MVRQDTRANIKKAIGILYNRADGSMDASMMPFQVLMRMTDSLTVEYLLKNVLYSTKRRYSRAIMKRMLQDSPDTSRILKACEHTLRQRLIT